MLDFAHPLQERSLRCHLCLPISRGTRADQPRYPPGLGRPGSQHEGGVDLVHVDDGQPAGLCRTSGQISATPRLVEFFCSIVLLFFVFGFVVLICDTTTFRSFCRSIGFRAVARRFGPPRGVGMVVFGLGTLSTACWFCFSARRAECCV